MYVYVSRQRTQDLKKLCPTVLHDMCVLKAVCTPGGDPFKEKLELCDWWDNATSSFLVTQAFSYALAQVYIY